MEYTETTVTSSRWRTVGDHKVLVVPEGEKPKIDDKVRDRLRIFAQSLNEKNSDKEINVGEFLEAEEALEYIQRGRQMFSENLD